MKKISTLLIVLSLVVLVIFSACGNKEESQIPNPMKEATGISDINSQIGCELVENEIITASGTAYTVIDGNIKIGDVKFTYNDAEYIYRSAKTKDDISGVYVPKDGDSLPLGSFVLEDQKPLPVSDSEFYARWMKGDYQYSLYSKGAKEEDFNKVYESLKG